MNTHPRTPIHLDQINGGALEPTVAAAMTQALGFQGNPSSLHVAGREAAQAVEKARQEVAQLIHANPPEIAFTSSGTEANTLALLGLTRVHAPKGKHLVISAVEHLSILHLARRLEKEIGTLLEASLFSYDVTVVPVNRFGRVDPAAVEAALTPETALVSIQWVNGEVGTIQPMADLVGRVKARGILFHSDAVSAVGQVPVDVRKIPVDALSMTCSAFGGPGGVGALYLRKGVRMTPFFIGGAQEDGRRAGTENLVGIVGFGEAARMIRRQMDIQTARLIPLRDQMIHGILRMIPETSLNGDPTERLPGHISVSIPGVDAEALVLSLDRAGVYVGLGSACTARTMKASHVLKAMGVGKERALGTITLTLSPQITEADVEYLLELLPHEVSRQRGEVVKI